MLNKVSKPLYLKFIKRGAVVLFVAEAICFAGSYALWYRLNTSRDFRLYMHQNYFPILDGYYKIGENLSSNDRTRNLDIALWRQEGKI